MPELRRHTGTALSEGCCSAGVGAAVADLFDNGDGLIRLRHLSIAALTDRAFNVILCHPVNRS